MSRLKADERISIMLREMYQQFGYLPYKVSKFEEYDLYMRNKSFLPSEHVLAFSDMDGKLMALKPDVTLSIIKNTKDGGAPVKVCYAENVYRVPRGEVAFREIMQVGLEQIGVVDEYALGEVLMLAAKSLQAISDSWALDVADLGVVSGILEGETLDAQQRAGLLACISSRNLHGLKAQCQVCGVGEETERLLCALVTEYGPLEETLASFEQMRLPAACASAIKRLRAMVTAMRLYGISGVNLDFSVVNDMNYYNGLIFSGFVGGVPVSVLSGGQYDYLMQKMGRSSQAIGFAVYLDQISRLMDARPETDVDVLIAYTDGTDMEAIIAAAQAAAADGQTVRVQREGETDVRCRKKILLGVEEAAK